MPSMLISTAPLYTSSQRSSGDMRKTSLFRLIVSVLTVIVFFACFNLSLYVLFTYRLSNNFSDTSQAKMIDVSLYLPHEEESDLARVDSSFKLTDNLPVLDGAAALVPVYASIIDCVYPKGSVTYKGGSFSDDNFYGENFAPDSKMQYKNTVRGYKAIVDGETDILFCASPSAEQKAYAEEKIKDIKTVLILAIDRYGEIYLQQKFKPCKTKKVNLELDIK